MGGRVEKGWCHVPLPLTQGPVPHIDEYPALYIVQGRAVLNDRGDILGKTGWDPSVCKSNRLQAGILWLFFIKLGYIL